MSETIVDLIDYGYIQARVFLASADTFEDEDRYPDIIAPTDAVVYITPVRRQTRVSMSTHSTALVLKQNIRCSVNSNGYLVDEEGNEGLWLVTGQYEARIVTGQLGDPPTFRFEVTTANTVEEPLDIITYVPPEAKPGPIPQWLILTQSQYDALDNKDPGTLYLIKD